MNFRSERYAIRIADENDSALIDEVLIQDSAAEGKIGVKYLRQPDSYASLCQEADKTVIALVVDKENNRVCGMGCVQLRDTFYNNVPCRAGYFTLLKIIPDYRMRVPVIPETFSFLLENGKADVYYSTILENNARAQRLLEKPRNNIPAFTKTSAYTVYCFKSGKREKSPLITEECDFGTFEKNFNAMKNKSDLCTVPKRHPGIKFYSLRDGKTVKSLCGVINQQSYKQYAIMHYKGIYRLLSKLPLQLLGYPHFPKAGKEANYASICMLNIDPSVTAAELRAFIKNVGADNSNYDFIMLGCTQKSLINEAFRRIKNVKYKSILFSVGETLLNDSDISLDVSFL